VFAIRKIPKGTRLFKGEDEIVWVPERNVSKLPFELKKLYDDFAIIRDGNYGCPVNFNSLTMSWYLNDSSNPNVVVDDGYDMWSIRDIDEGEELTIDSSKFSKQPYRELATAAAE
jgi:hypothetical protein